MELFQSWRKYDVIKRELVYQLDDNFEKVKDKYVYLRTSGIKKLLTLVRSLSEQEDISVFLRLQNHKETNIALHILAYVLQNLPVSILDQAVKPFPQVILKDETTPTDTPHPSSPGTNTNDTFGSVIIKGSTLGSNPGTGTFNSVVINKSNDSIDTGTYNSVVINKSSDSGTFNSVVINKSSDSDSKNNTYNSVVFNDGNDSDHSDTDYNTIAYNNNTNDGLGPNNSRVHEPVLLRRSAGGTAVYANPSTTEERAVALELIQGVCLIHPGSKSFLFENGILSLLILLLETKEDTPAATILASATNKNLSYSHSAPSLGGHLDRKPDEAAPKKDLNFPRKQEIMAILDALLCILVDHEPLQKEFVDLHGVEVCVKVLKNPAYGREVRAKCVVYLVYLVRYFPVGHRVKLLLIDTFGEQLTSVLLRSVRLGQPSDSHTVPGESFLDAFDKNVSLTANK